jgi:hypothetical protein
MFNCGNIHFPYTDPKLLGQQYGRSISHHDIHYCFTDNAISVTTGLPLLMNNVTHDVSGLNINLALDVSRVHYWDFWVGNISPDYTRILSGELVYFSVGLGDLVDSLWPSNPTPQL